MRKSVRVVCLTVAPLLIWIAVVNPVYGQKVDVKIKLKDKASSSCEIEVKDKRFKGICKSGQDDKKCDGNEFEWEVNDAPCTNLAKWTLVLSTAPNHPGCFSQSPIGLLAVFTDSDTGPKSSGLPVDFCTQNKFGTYWPYVLYLYDGGGNLVDSTDPGGVIFP